MLLLLPIQTAAGGLAVVALALLILLSALKRSTGV